MSNQENMNKYQSQKFKDNKINKKDIHQFGNIIEQRGLQLRETLSKCEDVLNNLNSKDSKHQKSWKIGMHNGLNIKKNKVEQSSIESKESLKTIRYNECKLSELLATCLKHTEEWVKIMKRIKKELDTNNPKKYSSNSSIQSESELERPVTMVKGIRKKLNELTEYMVNINEKIKNHKNKRSRQISNLKDTNYMLSELCNTIARKINDDI